MSAVDRTVPSQDQTLALDFELQHPPERVWRALTDPALLAQWLLPVLGFRPEPGAEFSFRTEPHPGWDGVVNCRVLAIEAYRKLSFTWGVPFLETVVTFTLTPTASGTRLSLVQSGFQPSQRREFGGARYGWTMMGERLVTLLGRLA